MRYSPSATTNFNSTLSTARRRRRGAREDMDLSCRGSDQGRVQDRFSGIKIPYKPGLLPLMMDLGRPARFYNMLRIFNPAHPCRWARGA
jgi:hypothetical protein